MSGAVCLPFRPRLNAPSGAQCFPTDYRNVVMWSSQASQCTFWCSVLSDSLSWISPSLGSGVSMHLLVLSAFRPAVRRQLPWRAGRVSMHLLVLSAFRPEVDRNYREAIRSQCTFWCSVLSDSAPRKPRHNAVYRNEIAADLESTTSNRPAPVQLNHTTAKNRHKTTQRRRRPLPASTPPASNEPKPKNRRLTTTSR